MSGSPLDILSPNLFRYADHVDNAMITAFGPHGGTGGDTPFDASVTSSSSVQLYTRAETPAQGRIVGLKVGDHTYGTASGNPIVVDSGNLLAATDIKIYVFTDIYPTGRIRCIAINGKPYGAALQNNEFSYEWTAAGGNACAITSIMGCCGDDVDRMGCVLQKNLPG